MDIAASVIIPFYNKIDILKLVLSGFERQSYQNFEIIIADDGSDDGIIHELETIISDSPLLIRHIWHPDNGWQKNTIMNKAIVSARSEFLIFTDGDCIPHRHFVKEHILAKEQNCVLTGRRVLLSKRISAFLSAKRVQRGYLEYFLFPWMVLERLLGKGEFVENAVYFKCRFIRNRINKKKRGLLGSNFSVHKADLLSINGFDERYQAPYVGEDTDLEYRLRLKGCKFRHLKHLAIQYHYFHPRLKYSSSNLDIFEDNKKRNTAYTPFGIIKK
jgi:glycosyltransferase involved in cell wall biosynthesis